MRLALILSALTLLAACGADGRPEQPAAQPGVSISGEGRMGAATKL